MPAIVDALEQAYELSFGNVVASGKRLLVAVDSSGSMTYASVTASGTPLGSAYEVANAVAAMLARTEGAGVHVIDVDTSVHASRVTPRTSLREIAGWQPSGGGTDLSLPFSWALRKRAGRRRLRRLHRQRDVGAGGQHPEQALTAYRRAVNPAAGWSSR